MLKHGRNVMREWPEDRANIETLYKPDSGVKNTASLAKQTLPPTLLWALIRRERKQLYSRGGYFMNGDPAAFDAPFFSITPQGMGEAAPFRLPVNPNADMQRQRLLRWTHSNDGFLRLLTELWKTVRGNRTLACLTLEPVNLNLTLRSWHFFGEGNRKPDGSLCLVYLGRLHHDDCQRPRYCSTDVRHLNQP